MISSRGTESVADSAAEGFLWWKKVAFAPDGFMLLLPDGPMACIIGAGCCLSLEEKEAIGCVLDRDPPLSELC